MYILKFLEDARTEFEEAAEWYEISRRGLGERFRNLVKNKIEVIQDHPERFPLKKGNFREATLKVFPYTIIYTFYKKEGTIVINSIFHMSRNPRKKYKKE
jgi:plasmid stabilization system protein ParE